MIFGVDQTEPYFLVGGPNGAADDLTTRGIDIVSDGENSTAVCDPQEWYELFGFDIARPPWEVFVVVIVLGAVILITVVGNVLVILSVFHYRPLRIAQNFFVVSLAVADLTVALLVLPFNIAYYIIGRWKFSIFLCKMWLTSDVLCCTASILNLCAIALDRYWAITDPINYAQKRTVNRVLWMIVITWVLSAIISSPPLIGWNDWPDTFNDTTPCELTSQKGYVIYSSSGSFFIPLLIMSMVYLQIFLATRRRLRERARASKLNAVKEILSSNKNNKDHLQQSPLEPESVSSEFTNCVQKANSFRSKSKCRKGKKGCKRTKCSQHALLVPRTQVEESLSDVPSISPGKATSSEGAEDAAATQNAAATADGQKICSVTGTGIERTHKNGQREMDPDRVTSMGCGGGACNKNSVASEQVLRCESTCFGGPTVAKKSVVHQFIEEKQRISLSKERKAARTLGIIMGVFVFCWLPFFLMYVIKPFAGDDLCISRRTVNIITWLGYINSALNPIIYTIFNLDFRKAFKKLLHIRHVS